MTKNFTMTVAAGAIAMLFGAGAWAQDAGLSQEVLDQLQAMHQTKAGFSAAQKKMDSALAYGILLAKKDASVASYTNAVAPLGTTDINGTPTSPASVDDTASNFVFVEITGDKDAIASAVQAAGGSVKYKSINFNIVDALVPISAVEAVAGSSAVKQIRVQSELTTNVGAVTSQGYISHGVNTLLATRPTADGRGVKVGVLSDSALPARITALKASGDLKPDAMVLTGLDGPTTGTDEGAAMMEIVQDMAPGAQVIFATAYNTPAQFADNIVSLANAGCKVIVDDISYFNEGVFQDGPVAQAVTLVTTTKDVVYFSAAANSGSITKNTSGTWEGDYKDGGVAPAGPVRTYDGALAHVHNFSSTATPQLFNTFTTAGTRVSLKWSDPLGASSNDYDLVVTNAAGTSLLGSSGGVQSGTQDPYEIASGTFPIGARVYIVAYSDATTPLPATRAFHLDGNRAQFSIATTGSTYGHNAAGATQTMAATYWNSAKTGLRAFTGPANTNESFSSDGPRKIFYNANGTAITPGNVLFATGGGTTLQKPDFSAADGVSTKTPGFLPFFGTSAAAPSAAGVAALIRSARPDYTAAQVIAAMRATALDNMAAGVDRDSGYGIPMANLAVQYAVSH